MLYQITDGTVSAGGHVILSHVDFEIKGNEKIALVGRNGAGKTTLLKLIAGELSLDRDDRRQGAGVTSSRRLTVGMLKQQAFSDREQTVEEILLAACPFRDTFARERFEYEQEYDRIFTGFGFARADKQKKIGDQCSAGCTKDIWEPDEIPSGICPHCGAPLTGNTIEAHPYIEEGYLPQWNHYGRK